MTAEPRDVPVPPDALAWICAVGRTPGYWATNQADVDAARRRGDRILPTAADEHGDRWIRGIAEHTHLADHLSLADTVTQLAAVVRRLQPPADDATTAAADSTAESAGSHTEPDGQPPSDRDVVASEPMKPSFYDPHEGRTLPSRGSASSPLPDPDEVLAAISGALERGTRQYRDADTGIPDFRKLWDRLDDHDRRLLAGYEEQVNHDTQLWADDRFRLGYALGTSGLLGLLE